MVTLQENFLWFPGPDLATWLVCIGFGIIVGGAPLYFGIRRICRARQQQEPIEEQIERKRKEFIAFVKENCIGCKFADEDAIEEALDEKSNEALLPLSSVIPSVKKEWCLRPEPPEVDSQYCYSRERKENQE